MSKEEPFDKLNDGINYDTSSKMSLNPPGLTQIGRTIVSDKFRITMDNFWFAINSNVIVNPFDFVSVKNLHNTMTIGIIKELQTVALNDNMMIGDIFVHNDKKSIKKETTTTCRNNIHSRFATKGLQSFSFINYYCKGSSNGKYRSQDW